jgi:GH35 family endo-1,4-beta-xylanase
MEPELTASLEAYRAEWRRVRPALDERIKANRSAVTRLRVVAADGRPVAGAKVRVRQKSHDFLFGCNSLMLGQLKELEAAYESAFTKLFNLATTTFCLGAVQPERGRFRFADGCEEVPRRPPPDRVLDFCLRNGLAAKGQPLLAGSWHPSWAADCSPEEAREIYADYFRRVAERYGNAYAMFDVVNEAFCHRKFPLFDERFEFVDWAFETASRLFPETCSLCINEFTTVNRWGVAKYGDRENDWGGDYYRLAKRLKEKGIRFDGVGFQCHLFSERELVDVLRLGRHTPDELLRVYDRMASLGKPLYITEVTVPSTLGGAEEGEKLQAEVAENFYRLWFAHPAFAGVTWWNFCDGAAWKREVLLLGGLLDANMREKPVYQTLYQLIRREWNTCAELTADANGEASFRGFFGRYDAIVEQDGREWQLEFSLKRGATGDVRLELPPKESAPSQ